MTVGKVKDFNFSKTAKDMSAAKCAGYAFGGSAKMGQSVQMAKSNAAQQARNVARLGAKVLGGPPPVSPPGAKVLGGRPQVSPPQVSPPGPGGYGFMAKGGKVKGYAKGGATAGKIIEEATGEKYPSRKAMVRHEREETPRMQKEELVQRSMVKGAIPRRQYPVAPAGPMISPQMARSMAPPAAAPMPAMKAGGKAMSKAGTAKVGKVMGEFKSGDLHSGAKAGPKVSSRKQAIAIAMSEARNVGKKKK